MEIKEYQKLTKETAIYPGVDGLLNGNISGLTYVILGLNGEAGEVAEILKKVIRDKNSELDEKSLQKFRGEIGDVFYYLVRTCSELGFDARDILQENIDKLFSRKERKVLQGSGSDR